MPTLKVTGNRDHVIIDLGTRLRDIILPPAGAENFWRELVRCADHCDDWIKSGGALNLFKGEPFGIENIKSWDGNVNIRFDRVVGPTVPMPSKIAREVAKQVMLKVEESKYHMTLDVHPVASTGG